MKNQKEELTFERASERLSEIITLLENAQTPLDDALVLFEEGVTLIKKANALLDGAEQKITILTGEEENK